MLNWINNIREWWEVRKFLKNKYKLKLVRKIEPRNNIKIKRKKDVL